MVGLPEECEPDPNALEKLDGCLSDLVGKSEKIDSVELIRMVRERNWVHEDC